MRQLTLEGRMAVFKSLALSKVMHLLLITKLRNNTIDLQHKTLVGKGKRQKLNTVLFAVAMKWGEGGKKNVDLRNKITSMQCSLVKRLFEDVFMIGK